MNYFAYQSAARRYASSRPYFHPVAIEKIKTFLRLSVILEKFIIASLHRPLLFDRTDVLIEISVVLARGACVGMFWS
jgi:hypothetical protein